VSRSCTHSRRAAHCVRRHQCTPAAARVAVPDAAAQCARARVPVARSGRTTTVRGVRGPLQVDAGEGRGGERRGGRPAPASGDVLQEPAQQISPRLYKCLCRVVCAHLALKLRHANNTISDDAPASSAGLRSPGTQRERPQSSGNSTIIEMPEQRTHVGPVLHTARISHWRRTTSSRAGCCRQCYRTCRATPPAAPAASDAHGARAGQSLSYCVPRLCLYFSVLRCVIVCFFHLTLVFGKSVGQKSRMTSQTRSRLPRLSAVWQERAPCTIPHDSRTLYPLIHSRYEYDSVRIVGLSDADRVSARSPLLPR
jgi:hypothetical protein